MGPFEDTLLDSMLYSAENICVHFQYHDAKRNLLNFVTSLEIIDMKETLDMYCLFNSMEIPSYSARRPCVHIILFLLQISHTIISTGI